MKSRKEKLPKGRSYPLRPSVLEAAISDACLELPVTLTRWDYKKEEVFEATFYPAGSLSGESFWVACGAAPSDKAAEIRAKIESEVIPKFIQWAKAIEALDLKSPRRRMTLLQFKWEFSKAAA